MNEVIEKHYKENYDLFVKRMKNKLGSQEDAEDVVQEAFTRALKYFESYDSSKGSSFDAWFGRILINVCKKFSNDRRLGGLTKNLDDSLHEIDPEITDFLGALTKKEVRHIISTKGGIYGEVLLLNITFGYKPEEISIITGATNNYIRKMLNNFKNELKELYGERHSI